MVLCIGCDIDVLRMDSVALVFFSFWLFIYKLDILKNRKHTRFSFAKVVHGLFGD